ncbi:hypothetical protein [Hyunsoonleella ulvae]|uniref:hypothetical protein n=1 Tax=Hyunsoonleella ulvae TaxID=2799948 RepID=UPI00193A73A5|nr:hypothetical protein [Hyunsoonleella ulvae]
MCSPKVLATFVGFIYALFVYFLFSGNILYADGVGALILPVITLGYFLHVKKRSLYLILFLIFHSISDILMLFSQYMSDDVDYFVGNTLYVLAYIALAIEIAKDLSISYILKHYLFSIIVLFLLNVYISYVLFQIISTYLDVGIKYVLELVYNISMLIILSLALLNYFCKDSRKAFYILVGAICIVFSEVISIAYLYVSDTNLLNFFAISLGLIGFYFLYEQAKLKYRKQDKVLH